MSPQDRPPMEADTMKAVDAPEPLLRFFECDHLPPRLRQVAMPFALIALDMESRLRPSAERSAGLRKLLEAKDCMVRAAL